MELGEEDPAGLGQARHRYYACARFPDQVYARLIPRRDSTQPATKRLFQEGARCDGPRPVGVRHTRGQLVLGERYRCTRHRS